MGQRRFAAQWASVLAAASLIGTGLVGCSNKDGSDGAAGVSGVVIVPVQTATALTITITGVSVSSPPVVNFRVTNQDGESVTGLSDGDLRFNIAKLVPGTFGNPYKWQNYINRASGGAVQGSQERFRTQKDYGWGTLVPHGDGTYAYTFCTDITNVTTVGANQNFANCSQAPQPNFCPTPCTDANGNVLDISYQPGLTHRVSIQQANAAYPKYNATFDFVPGGGAVFHREIVKTGKCNECHNQLAVHGGTRVETRLCVTCHNPGSWVAGTTNTPVDFKVMIHKIHRGEELPSVVAGGKYAVGNSDFSTVAFPQDIRNCTKCHDGADPETPQGDNWKTQPSREACGSCHDNVNFATGAGHPGGIKDNSTCLACHSSGGEVGPVETSHAITAKLARGNFKFNILEICGVPVATSGAGAGTAATAGVTACQPGGTPTVAFSVTNPTTGTPYNIFADPAFWGTTAPVGSLTIDIAWDTRDYSNTDGSQARPARANQFNVYGTTAVTNPYGNVSIPAYPAAVPHPTIAGAYLLTAATPIPASATGSGAVALEGRAFSVVPDPGLSGSAANRIPIKAEVAYFGITDTTPKARRVAVDAATKCDNCHDQLSLHGGGRNDNVQLCVMCHNPNNTDAQASARPKETNHLPKGTVGTTADGKKEESVDFKRMIHGIHAGATKSLDGATTLFGFREKGIWISGSDFSGVRFPGILNDCATCHVGTSYQLTGTWETPAQNGIQGSTIDTVPFSTTGITSASTSAEVDAELNNRANDLKISPTAAVCSSCHDGATTKAHMQQNGGLFSDTPAVIGANFEQCSICHGPGRVADVQVVHGVK